WDEVKRFENPHTFYVDLSQKLWDIKHALLRENGIEDEQKMGDESAGGGVSGTYLNDSSAAWGEP
uniref:hypothetical protein n=1 Tax=uncultured Dysosmobacter sp. TaxID=2591384 RepID=UPI002601F2FC